MTKSLFYIIYDIKEMMKKLLYLSLGLMSISAQAQILNHSKEIGLYSSDKNVNFIKDNEVLSPKSADFIGNSLVINALEGGKTLFYNTESWTKEPTIEHQFKQPTFEKIDKFPYKTDSRSFMGKPVEMTHNNEKMWIPYYRLSWDSNSRSSSAIAQIDIKTHQVEKLLPAGSIPKMVQVSHDNKMLVSTHWGDNTIGIYDLENNNVKSYSHIIIDKQLDISKISGDRDKNCGWCLRGTVISADDNYILIGKMGGGGIAVVDAKEKKYLGTLRNVPLTPRHIVLSKDGRTLYLSTCFSSEVAKISMDKIEESIQELKANKKVSLQLKDWNIVKVGSSVRTIALSKDEKYIYATMNDSSQIAVIDNQTMKVLEKYKVSSFPVGLSVSDDDKYIAVTSQGKAGKGGGNHVDIFERVIK